jgi:hypothetical protein
VTVKVAPAQPAIAPPPAPAVREGASGDAAKRQFEQLREQLQKAFGKTGVKAAPLQPAMVKGVVQPNVNFAVQRQANIDMLAQQWEPRLRPMLRAEYRFMRTVCEPTKEQRLPIVRRSGGFLKETAKALAASQINPQPGGRSSPNYRSVLVEHLASAAKEHLTAEQYQKYRKELDARTADEKQAAIMNLVARLDQNLSLSGEQREKIGAALGEKWDESWSQNLEMFMRLADQYVPSIPDDRIVPFLDPTQRQLWSGLQKIGSINFGFSFALNGVPGNDDGPLDDDWPDEPKAGAP